MKSKLLFFSLAALMLTFKISFAQSLTFCDKADVNGKPVNANTTFTVAKDGGPVMLLLTLPSSSNIGTISFDIYRLNNGKEVLFTSTKKEPVDASKNFVAKQITFYDEGRYRVYVFDEHDKQLARAEVLIKK